MINTIAGYIAIVISFALSIVCAGIVCYWIEEKIHNVVAWIAAFIQAFGIVSLYWWLLT